MLGHNLLPPSKSFYISAQFLYNIAMGMRICSLSSGSKGNCIYVGTEKSSILVDVGISLSKIKKCMEIFGADLSQTDVFITHTHVDHIKYLSQIAKHCRAVYCSPVVAQQIEQSAGYKTKITDFDKIVGVFSM